MPQNAFDENVDSLLQLAFNDKNRDISGHFL